MIELEQQVKKANKDFYDIIGPSYEAIDGRRSWQLAQYVSNQIKMLSQKTDSDTILDLGCGSGFISKIAKNYFRKIYAIDISFKIMKSIVDQSIRRISADSDFIPLKDAQFNCIITFALLHHCYSYEKMLSEIYRLLKKNGIYYSDHDMDELFFKKFRLIIWMYRKIANRKKCYISRTNLLSEKMYDCSEYHQNGVSIEVIKSILKRIGFRDIAFQFHWFGLSGLTNKIFGKRVFKRGYAPLIRILAKK